MITRFYIARKTEYKDSVAVAFHKRVYTGWSNIFEEFYLINKKPKLSKLLRAASYENVEQIDRDQFFFKSQNTIFQSLPTRYQQGNWLVCTELLKKIQVQDR